MRKRVYAVSLCLCVTLSAGTAFSADIDWGGELRFRPEMRNNRDFDSDQADNEAFIGQRVRISATAKKDEKISAFVQIQDTRRWGSVGNTGTAKNESGTHENLDIYQAFIDVKEIISPHFSAKIGRQTLVYGDQRLLGHLGWKDEARTFDAFKGSFTNKIFNSDVFFSKLKETAGKPGSSTNDDDLYGVYTTVKALPEHKIDLYYLYWKNDLSRKVSTYGIRISGKTMKKLDYTGEFVVQSGDWTATLDQQALAFAFKIGYSLNFPVTRIGFEYDHGSGDDGNDATKHKNFVFPFHTNHAQYGYMDYFSWGNMNDFRVQVNGDTAPFKWQIDYHFLTLDKGTGDWLNVAGTSPFKSAVAGKNSTAAGQEVDLTVKYIYSPAFKIVGGYSIFIPGNAAKERSSDKSDNSDWGYLITQFNF